MAEAYMASQNGLWQRWLHKMASGRDGFTKWPPAEMASQNGLWQRWLRKMASGRDDFTKWPLAEMASQNGHCCLEVGRFRSEILLQSSRWEMIMMHSVNLKESRMSNCTIQTPPPRYTT